MLSPNSLRKSLGFIAKAMDWLTVAFAALTIATSFLVYNYQKVDKRVKLYFEGSPKNTKLVSLCKSLNSKYFPHPLFFFSGVSIIEGTISYLGERFRRELATPDGGTMSLDFYDSENFKPSTITLLLLPGFEGGSESTYIRRIVVDAARNGYRPVVLNFRGYADLSVTSPLYHNLSETRDLLFAVQQLKEILPKAPIIAAGFSMGSNNLIKYLCDTKSNCGFVAAISAGNPYDLNGLNKYHYDSRHPLMRYWFEIYHKAALWKLKSKIWKNRNVFEKAVDVNHVMKAKTLVEFSERFSKVLYKLGSAEEYYYKGSCCNFINSENISIPLLCINALDDPLVPERSIPYQKLRSNKNVILATTAVGGHLAWLNNKGNCWMNEVCIQFTQAVEATILN